MLYIDQVEKGKDVHGCEVITHVCYTNVLSQKAYKKCTKREMINFINQNPNTIVKTKYIKSGVWFSGAEVLVVNNEYLRTDGNNKKADNLGELD